MINKTQRELRDYISETYELYEQRGRQSGQPDQDWLKAEREMNLEAIQ